MLILDGRVRLRGRKLRLAGRQRHGKGASTPETRVSGQRSTVCAGDPLADGEAKTESTALIRPRAIGALDATRARSVRPIEALEDVRKIGSRDADAGVADGERDA